MTDLSKAEPREVLLVWLGRLGDFIAATPFLASARKRWPRARITLLTGAKGREAASLDPHADELWTVEPYHRAPANLGLFARLLARRFDLAVDLNPSYSRGSGLLVRMSRAPLRVSFQKRRAGLFYTDLVPHDPEHDNMVLSYGRLAAAFGAPFEGVTRVYPRPADRTAAAALLSGTGADPAKAWLAVHPGNFKKTKNRWPEEKFIQLTRRLQDPGLEVFYVAGPGEEAKVASMLKELPGVRYLPPASAGVSAAALARMDLMVGNSTGAMHLGAAAGTPTFTLFSRYTREVWSLPEGPHTGVVSEAWSDCRDIPVEKAYAALAPVLDAARAVSRPKTLP